MIEPGGISLWDFAWRCQSYQVLIAADITAYVRPRCSGEKRVQIFDDSLFRSDSDHVSPRLVARESQTLPHLKRLFADFEVYKRHQVSINSLPQDSPNKKQIVDREAILIIEVAVRKPL